MICRLRGLLREQGEMELVIDVGGVCYQVFVPPCLMPKILERVSPAGEIELVTYHYQQLDVGKGFSVLIGFTNEVEREFFERFISVSGVGPKAALKALTMPIASIAQAIHEGDVATLKSLRGIGEQRAREIVAKLQGKVGKFALIQGQADGGSETSEGAAPAFENEAIAVLLQLEYSKPEAKQMVKAALARNSKIGNAEELLNEVYRQRQAEPPAASTPRSMERQAA